MPKGPAFEREFCKKLSLWWTGGKRDDVFWRTSNSGGRASVRKKKNKATANSCGDVCAIDPVGFPLTNLITFEIKRGYSRHTIADLLDKPEGAAKQVYEKWIEQAKLAAENACSPFWALVVKRDHRAPLMFMPESLMIATINEGQGEWPHLCMYIPVIRDNVCAEPLEDFFKRIEPQEFVERVNELLEIVTDVR